MKPLLDFFCKRSFVVNLISFIICLIGFLTFLDMRRDLIPGMQFKVIRISAILPGASAIDMEKNVTFPVEEAINNFAGVEKIESTTTNGLSQIDMYFLPDFDELAEAVENAKARIDGLKTQLPDKLEPVDVQQIKIDSVDFLNLGFFGVDENSADDRAWIRSLEDRVRKVVGIVKVRPHLEKREIQIEFLPEEVERYGLSITEVRQKIAASLSYAPIGQIQANEKNITIELRRNMDSLEEIAALPIFGNRAGHRLVLKDIAEVRFGYPDRVLLELVDGQPYVVLELFKDMDSDAINLRNEVLKILEEFRGKLPKHLSVEMIGDGPFFIEKQLAVLKNNGLTGLILVVLSLFLFLGFRISLVTAMGIPLSYLGTFIVLDYLGVSIDLISVVGMILVIGILVDDAIIVAEKYVQNLEENMKPFMAAGDAAISTIIPVTGTVITTIVAFAPILLMDSAIKTVLYAIPCVIISALVLSWFESFFVLPNHLQHFVKTKSKRADNSFIRNLRRFYEVALAWSLRWRYALLIFFLIFTGFSIFWVGGKVEKNFNSFSISSERVEISAVLKKSDSLQETADKLKALTRFIRDKYPKEEVAYIFTEIGDVRINHRQMRGYRYATIEVEVADHYAKPAKLRKKIEAELQPELARFKTEDFEQLDIRSVKSGEEDAKEDIITVFVSGGDQLSFEELQNEIQTVLKGKEHIQALPMAPDRMQKSWQFYIDKNELTRYQLGYGEIIGQLSEFFSPQELAEVRMQGESLTIYTKNEKKKDIEFKDLNRLKIISPRGLAVPVSSLGEWRQVEVLRKIEHKNLLRKFEIDVKYDKDQVKKEVVTAGVREAIEPLIQKFPAYNFTVLDEDEQTSRNRREMIKIASTCMILILLVLALTLNSVVQPLIVAFAIPFGVIGIIWALYLHGLPMGIMALIGLIGMAGVVVNDSLIMVDSINKERHRFVKYNEAVIAGAGGRLRSILLTTVTTLGGVFPMAYGIGGESGFTQPLAFAMGWGLTFATFLTLFVLPAILVVQNDFYRLYLKLIGGVRRAFRRAGRDGEPAEAVNI